nr:GntR family transcriptional regulator [uncultured Bacillus sp.]
MFKGSVRLAGENNKEYSYRVIKEGIMSLRLKPGQTISEVELADALQISRTPIREVMGKLREEYLVEVLPQVGSYISKIKLQLIEEAAFMRYTLEKEVMKMACQSFPEDKLRELKRNVALQEEIVVQKTTDCLAFHKLDTKFHSIIFQGNYKEHVWNAITRLSTHYNRMRVLSEMENSYHTAFSEHKNIIKLIEEKDIEHVEEVVHKHILEPAQSWGKLYQPDSPYVDYFDLSSQMPILQ